MAKEAVFTLKLEAELRDRFMQEAAATDRPASQIVREFMRTFVERQRQAREHDAWFRAEVKQALREADEPQVKRIPHAEIRAKLRRRRAERTRRAGRKSA